MALAGVALLLLVPPAAANGMPTEAFVRNAAPEVLGAQVLVDPTLGALLYDIEARDGNGIEDLRTARITFHGADGRVLHTHEDHRPAADGRRAALWYGSVLVPQALLTGIERATVTVVDAHGGTGTTDTSVGLRPVERVVEDPGRGWAPLAHEVMPFSAQPVALWASGASATALLALLAYGAGRASRRLA